MAYETVNGSMGQKITLSPFIAAYGDRNPASCLEGLTASSRTPGVLCSTVDSVGRQSVLTDREKRQCLKKINAWEEHIVSIFGELSLVNRFPLFSPSTIPLQDLGYVSNILRDNEMRKARIQYLEEVPNGSLVYSKKFRRIPQVGRNDTLMEGKSKHGELLCFENREIISTGRIDTLFCIAEDEYGRESMVEVDPKKMLPEQWRILGEGQRLHDGKMRCIIHQQATRGCMAAVGAMLIGDRKGAFSLRAFFRDLREANLWTEWSLTDMFFRAGLSVINPKIDVEKEPLLQLKTTIELYGSAIIPLCDPQTGGHVIIVDDVDFKHRQILVREPYHGMLVWITFEAFLKKDPYFRGITQLSPL